MDAAKARRSRRTAARLADAGARHERRGDRLATKMQCRMPKQIALPGATAKLAA